MYALGFSIKLNGSLEGYFKGESGLRQGDPLSPYLFVIAMEALTACINKNVESSEFSYHWRTKELNLSHLIFADDVFLFCKGDMASVQKIMKGVNEFSKISGLSANISKSRCFFGNVEEGVANDISSATGFARGRLPVSYLGLPLISAKVKSRDCAPLISRFCDRIEKWTCRLLNFGGRLQLSKSILSSISGFWSMYLFLPKSVLHQLNSLIFKFLWGGFYKANGRCHHKVNWLDCGKSKPKGGLGLRNIFEWNQAAILFQVWRLSQPSPSIWPLWFHNCLLKKKRILDS